MKIHVVSGRSLTAEHIQRWTQIVESCPELASPFYRPEFTQEVAAVRDDVEVAVLEDGGRTAGYFPFERNRRNMGDPVGGVLSDFHGLIAPSDVVVDPIELMKACRLKAWRFHQLLASQATFQRYHWVVAESPYMDLSAGFEEYRASCHSTFRRTEQKSRKAEREIGPMRLVTNSDAAEVFQTLVDWKTAQYRRIKAPNYLSGGWILTLLQRLCRRRDAALLGMLSVLYFGDRMAAVHLGLRSKGVLHLWFPAYSEELACYSPGLQLVAELAKASPGLGIVRLDMGRGATQFKTGFRSAAVNVAEGAVDNRTVASTIGWTWARIREWGLASPLRDPARFLVRSARSLLTRRS